MLFNFLKTMLNKYTIKPTIAMITPLMTSPLSNFGGFKALYEIYVKKMIVPIVAVEKTVTIVIISVMLSVAIMIGIKGMHGDKPNKSIKVVSDVVWRCLCGFMKDSNA